MTTAVHLWLGVRGCPNVVCGGPVFMVVQGSSVLASFPPEVIDFDSSNVPQQIASCLSEAILCSANGCHRAAALMVRRVLEELCHERGAKGKNLQDRVAALRDCLTLPKALFDAMTELRLLGNDAAHIEAKTYDAVGVEEVSTAIELAKEIIKAAYQFDDLVSRLRALSVSGGG